MVRNDRRGSGRLGTADGVTVGVADEDGGDDRDGVADGGAEEDDREGAGSAAHPAPTVARTSVATSAARRRTRAIRPR
jgi:hypothetical protein